MKHIQVAKETGLTADQTILLEDGHGVEFLKGTKKLLPPMQLSRSVVDGRDLGDIASLVLRDRRQLSETGMVVVIVIVDAHSGEVMRGPELFARGLAFEEMEGDLLQEAKEIAEDTLSNLRNAIENRKGGTPSTHGV